MKLPNFSFKSVERELTNTWDKNNTKFMTGFAIFGVILTAVSAFEGGIKACKIIEEAEKEEGRELTNSEKFVRVYKVVIPPFASATITAFLMYGAYNSGMRKQAALFEAYYWANKAKNDFKKEAVNAFGEKKVTEVEDKVVKGEIEEAISRGDITYTTKGNTLIWDNILKRLYRGDISYTERKLLDLEQATKKYGDEIDLNDYSFEFGLPNNLPYGNQLGWDDTIYIEARPPKSILLDNGEPAYVVDLYNVPSIKFKRCER